MSLSTPSILAAALLAALLAACSSASDTVGSPSPTPSTPAPVSSTAAAPTPSPNGFTIKASIAGGKVSPAEATYPIAVGTPVTVIVTSDAADVVHSHCSDQEKPVAAGGSVTLSFTVKNTGVCEVETHESDLVLFQLAVS